MDPRADLAAEMMHDNLASAVETVENAIRSRDDMAVWICNNSVMEIDTVVTANNNLLETARVVSADWLHLTHEAIGYWFGCMRALLVCRAPQELTDVQEGFVRNGLLVLSIYAQRFRFEAARMSEEIGRKNGSELIESGLTDSEQLGWAA
jgi:hypothetical protein